MLYGSYSFTICGNRLCLCEQLIIIIIRLCALTIPASHNTYVVYIIWCNIMYVWKKQFMNVKQLKNGPAVRCFKKLKYYRIRIEVYFASDKVLFSNTYSTLYNENRLSKTFYDFSFLFISMDNPIKQQTLSIHTKRKLISVVSFRLLLLIWVDTHVCVSYQN